jgi:hypothetical protein
MMGTHPRMESIGRGGHRRPRPIEERARARAISPQLVGRRPGGPGGQGRPRAGVGGRRQRQGRGRTNTPPKCDAPPVRRIRSPRIDAHEEQALNIGHETHNSRIEKGHSSSGATGLAGVLPLASTPDSSAGPALSSRTTWATPDQLRRYCPRPCAPQSALGGDGLLFRSTRCAGQFPSYGGG